MSATQAMPSNSNNGRYLSDAEHAAALRAKLKAAGINSRQVSVRVTPGGSIRATIRDLKVRKVVVTEAGGAHEHIDRDVATGEILSGGNRFVFVGYDDAVVRDAAAPIAHFITNEFTGRAGGDIERKHVELAHGFIVERRHSLDFLLWRPGHECAPFHANSIDGAAERYVERLAELGLF
jgi:hypothetical protein